MAPLSDEDFSVLTRVDENAPYALLGYYKADEEGEARRMRDRLESTYALCVRKQNGQFVLFFRSEGDFDDPHRDYLREDYGAEDAALYREAERRGERRAKVKDIAEAKEFIKRRASTMRKAIYSDLRLPVFIQEPSRRSEGFIRVIMKGVHAGNHRLLVEAPTDQRNALAKRLNDAMGSYSNRNSVFPEHPRIARRLTRITELSKAIEAIVADRDKLVKALEPVALKGASYSSDWTEDEFIRQHARAMQAADALPDSLEDVPAPPDEKGEMD